MAVKIRLLRMGAKKKPFYRVVVADSRTKRDGKYIELVGTYNPVTDPAEIKLNEEVAIKWLSEGAIPTDTVKSLFNKAGINEKFHNLKSGKKETKKEVKKQAPKPSTAKAEVKKPAPKKTTETKTPAPKKAAEEKTAPKKVTKPAVKKTTKTVKEEK